MMAQGRGQRAKTGKSIDGAALRHRADPAAACAAISRRARSWSFRFESVESMYAFRANDVVGKIAPRPLLLLHSANDSVTPTEQSIDLFPHAGQPTDLHLVADVDHFMFAEGNKRVWDLVRNWLNDYFPVAPAARTHAAE